MDTSTSTDDGGIERRRFIRHPSGIPLEIRPAGDHPGVRVLEDVGIGGVRFRADRAVPPGELVRVRIDVVLPPFEAEGRVAWCAPRDDAGFDVAVAFERAADRFAIRMVEQICHIEEYRREQARVAGRELTPEQAAAEWIRVNAQAFPEL